jgi:hypothetical protein
MVAGCSNLIELVGRFSPMDRALFQQEIERYGKYRGSRSSRQRTGQHFLSLPTPCQQGLSRTSGDGILQKRGYHPLFRDKEGRS